MFVGGWCSRDCHHLWGNGSDTIATITTRGLDSPKPSPVPGGCRVSCGPLCRASCALQKLKIIIATHFQLHDCKPVAIVIFNFPEA